MVYVGSKNRLAKDLIPIITKDLKKDQWYVEPFVGGANMIDKVEHPLKIGADINKYLIALLNYVQEDNELPNELITIDQYRDVKYYADTYPDWFVGYCGFICSFRGLFLNSYSGIAGGRNYQDERKRNLLKLNLNNIIFKCSSYDKLDIPDNSIIYCDPPYKGVKQYGEKFDTEKFWEWCRQKVAEGHKVYVSEYEAPSDFVCIWQKEIINSLSNKNSKITQEKLYIHKSLI